MTYEDIEFEDLARCAKVYVEVFNSPPWNEDWAVPSALARLTEIAGTPGFAGLKIVTDDSMVGFVMGYTESFDAGGDYYLKEMCVVPARQRQGIGTALLQELKTRLIDKGARKLYLLTARGGSAARYRCCRYADIQ